MASTYLTKYHVSARRAVCVCVCKYIVWSLPIPLTLDMRLLFSTCMFSARFSSTTT